MKWYSMLYVSVKKKKESKHFSFFILKEIWIAEPKVTSAREVLSSSAK